MQLSCQHQHSTSSPLMIRSLFRPAACRVFGRHALASASRSRHPTIRINTVFLESEVTQTAAAPPAAAAAGAAPRTAAAPTARPAAVGSQAATKPGELDAQRFQLQPSVYRWQDFNGSANLDADASTATQFRSLLQSIQDNMRGASVFSSRESVAYWSYHLARMGFFTATGIAGLFGARTASAATGEAESVTGLRLEKLLQFGASGPVVEALNAFQQDYENIQAGVYKLPWDMVTAPQGHRQVNPLYMLRKMSAFVREAADTLSRRDRRQPDAVWLESNLYPEYYMNTWHYQSDGWLSKQSAEVYEASTETLFLGRQDSMQRQTLVPMHYHMQQQLSPRGAGMKMLEVACGTGRFATFAKDNYPGMDITCLDLSPYYLEEARDNMAYWHKMRAAAVGGASAGDAFLQAAAENIPAPDNSFDVVTCIYLFHELPSDVRRKAVAEMARVCKPGGLVVLTDSVQLGDRRAWDASLGNFGNFNEPYYNAYISTDIGELFENEGLQPDMKTMSSSTKALSFKKPLHRKEPVHAAPPQGVPAL